LTIKLVVETRFPTGNAHPPETLAALVLLSPAEPDLSPSLHQVDIAPLPHLAPDSCVVPEAAPEPLMMAQQVPHQTHERRRVKVYELRHNDWFDRGTGFCFACWVPVRFNFCCAAPSSTSAYIMPS